MSDPFIAEVRIFAGNFAPRNWAFCNGQLVQIAQNTALFSLVGTTYGGDGRTTFGLPGLQGRVAMHAGNGPGLSQRRLGERAGVTEVTLNSSQVPNHTHAMRASPSPGESSDAQGNALARAIGGAPYQTNTTANLVSLASQTLPARGGNSQGTTQAHSNMQPYLGLFYIIALTGTFPSRN